MSDVKYTSHASTPAQFQADMVEWLKLQATDYRARARGLARTKKGIKEYTDKAEAYEYAASFIRSIVIEPVPDAIPPSWITHPWNADAIRDYAARGSPAITTVDIDQGIVYWVKRERIIEAIKCYRYHTNAGLLDAKNYVEKLKDDLTNQTI